MRLVTATGVCDTSGVDSRLDRDSLRNHEQRDAWHRVRCQALAAGFPSYHRTTAELSFRPSSEGNPDSSAATPLVSQTRRLWREGEIRISSLCQHPPRAWNRWPTVLGWSSEQLRWSHYCRASSGAMLRTPDTRGESRALR